MKSKRFSDRILSFNWKKTIILIVFGAIIVFYATSKSYACIDKLDGVLIDAECAKLNFSPHLLVKIGTAVVLSPIITIFYSLFRYFRRKRSSYIN